MMPDGESWATFMGQVEHVWLRLAMAQFAPSKKNTNRKKKHFILKWLRFSSQIIDRRQKHFAIY